MEAQKPNKPKAAPKAANKKGGLNAILVIILCFVASVLFYMFVLGAESNYENGHPINLMGTIHEGGFVVPIIQGLLILVVVLSVERFIALRKARGSKGVDKSVGSLKKALEADDLAGAKEICKKQGGAIGNAVLSSVEKYAEMSDKNNAAVAALKKEDRVLAIRNALDEQINMEMPTLQQNMAIIFTNTTLGTLMGLFGTVLGMIKSFSALSASGAPDSAALSTGISEALVNTASGIATGALAVISYNYFSAQIDDITYKMNEAGAVIIAVYEAKN